MFHLKELWSHLLLIVLRQCLAWTLGPVLVLTTGKGYQSSGSFSLGDYPHMYPSWAPYQLPPHPKAKPQVVHRRPLLMCILISGNLLGLATCLFDNHHRLFPLGPVLALFWLHSEAWHFILLLVSFAISPRTGTSVFLYCAVIGSQSLGDPILCLSLVPNKKRTVNNVYGVV